MEDGITASNSQWSVSRVADGQLWRMVSNHADPIGILERARFRGQQGDLL